MTNKYANERNLSAEPALEKIIKAWENTKAGNTTVKEIQRWLIEDMKPAIDAGRAALAQRVLE